MHRHLWWIQPFLVTFVMACSPVSDPEHTIQRESECMEAVPELQHLGEYAEVAFVGEVSLFSSGTFSFQRLGEMMVPLPHQDDASAEKVVSNEGTSLAVQPWRVIGSDWRVLVWSTADNPQMLEMVRHLRASWEVPDQSPLVARLAAHLADENRSCKVTLGSIPALAAVGVLLAPLGADERVFAVTDLPAILVERVSTGDANGSSVELELLMDDPRHPDGVIRISIAGKRAAALLNKILVSTERARSTR